jgi:hypothetical protein
MTLFDRSHFELRDFGLVATADWMRKECEIAPNSDLRHRSAQVSEPTALSLIFEGSRSAPSRDPQSTLIFAMKSAD